MRIDNRRPHDRKRAAEFVGTDVVGGKYQLDPTSGLGSQRTQALLPHGVGNLPRYGFTFNAFHPVTSPANGPLGKVTRTSTSSTVTVAGTRTGREQRRPQWNAEVVRSRGTLPGSVRTKSATTSRP